MASDLTVKGGKGSLETFTEWKVFSAARKTACLTFAYDSDKLEAAMAGTTRALRKQYGQGRQ